MPKSALRKPNANYKKIIAFLKAVKDQPFSTADVVAKTGVSMVIASVFLGRKVAQGFLNRSSERKYGVGYEYSVIKLPLLEAAKGSIANAVWKVFRKAETPLRRCEVAEIVNLGRKPGFSYDSINNVITRLYGQSALVKTDNLYSIFPGLKKRPTTKAQKKKI